MKRNAHDISLSIERLGRVRDDKNDIFREKLAFEKEKYWMEQASALFGSESNAPKVDKGLAVMLMRKCILSPLTGMFTRSAKATHYTYK